MQEKITLKAKAQPGKNHQYFSGNTVFFLGGRIQNTNAKPINIATGAIIVVPTILFFLFS
jgi:palmitoyltransferase ZDHHC9/14/18